MSNSKEILVYSRQVCANCATVKNFLKAKGLAYQEISLDNDQAKAAFLAVYPSVRTVPQVVIDGVRVENLHTLGQLLS
jgi:glutaredoxin